MDNLLKIKFSHLSLLCLSLLMVGCGSSSPDSASDAIEPTSTGTESNASSNTEESSADVVDVGLLDEQAVDIINPNSMSAGTDSNASSNTDEGFVDLVDVGLLGEQPTDIIDQSPTTIDTAIDDNPDLVSTGGSLTFRTNPIPALPPRCIGAIDSANSTFCVNPETRELSATTSEGVRWWGFILPGSNDSNQIESVLVTDDWLILIADRQPIATSLTPAQRSDQYEASVFRKDGMFVRTVDLPNDLQTGNGNETREVTQDSVAVVALQSSSGNPLALIGFNPWSAPLPGENVLLASYDLSSGQMLASYAYRDQSISELALDANGSGVLRVVTNGDVNTVVNWHESDTLSRLSNDVVTTLFPNSLIALPSGEQSQLNAGNYSEVINRLLPWVNAEIPTELVFGSSNFVPTRDSWLSLDEFSLLEEFDDGRFLYGCANQGLITREFDVNSLLDIHTLDQCSALNAVYSGTVSERLGSTGGFLFRASPLTRVENENNSVQGSVRYTVSEGNFLQGSVRTYDDGSFSVTDTENPLDNAIVTNFDSRAGFQHGNDNGNQNVSCYTLFDEGTGNPIGRFFCNLIAVRGEIDSSFVINAEWTNYSPVTVTADLFFGEDYWEILEWFGPAELEPELPASITTTPPSEFYFRSGSIEITAADSSRIVLLPEDNQFPLMSVRIFDKNGVESGNFPLESVNIKCAERVGVSCVL